MNKMGARGIIEHGGKFLLVRNIVSPDFWCLPGGGIEQGEDVLSAIKRELIEETGIEPVIGNLLYVHQIQNENGYGTPEFFFYIKNGSEYLNLDINKTTHGQAELAEIKFVDIKTVKLLPSFLIEELSVLATNKFNTPTRFRLSNLN